MKLLNAPRRRHFLKQSALVAAGLFSASVAMATGLLGSVGANGSQRVDRKLAAILRSYGRSRRVEGGGFERTRVGKRMRRLPVTRLSVKVTDRHAFLGSFQELTRLSKRVRVDGNTVRLVRDGRLVVIENHLA